MKYVNCSKEMLSFWLICNHFIENNNQINKWINLRFIFLSVHFARIKHKNNLKIFGNSSQSKALYGYKSIFLSQRCPKLWPDTNWLLEFIQTRYVDQSLSWSLFVFNQALTLCFRDATLSFWHGKIVSFIVKYMCRIKTEIVK